MPLLRIDLIEGRTDAQIRTLADAVHGAVLAAFHVPPRDRYQIVQEHKPSRFFAEDTGLGFNRTDQFVLVQVTSRPRGREAKKEFYRLLCERLKSECGIDASDVVISMIENADEDWSFGMGEAQFLTGALG